MISTSKDPNSTEDFRFDWSALVSNGDSISSSTWTVPSGLTKLLEDFSPTTSRVRISGGTNGQLYTLENTVTLASGQVLARGLQIVSQLA